MIVTVDVPSASEGLTVRVKVLVVVAGLGAKPTVTPLGRPDALKLTLPLNPFTRLIMIVLAPLLPCTILNEAGLALRLKSGLATKEEQSSDSNLS